MHIASTPPGARVTVIRMSGRATGLRVYTGVTPATVTLARKHDYEIVVSGDGYQEVRVPISKSGINRWAIADIAVPWGAFGAVGLLTQEYVLLVVPGIFPIGVLCVTMDYVSGALWKVKPESVVVTLEISQLRSGRADGVCAVLYVLEGQSSVRRLVMPLTRASHN